METPEEMKANAKYNWGDCTYYQGGQYVIFTGATNIGAAVAATALTLAASLY